MSTRSSTKKVLALLALGAVLGLDSACADLAGIPEERTYEPGTVCPGTIPIKILADLTGATSDVGVPYYAAENDFIREINATGGIRGCQLEAQHYDYAYDPSSSVAKYDEWKSQPEWPRVAAILGWGSGDTIKLAPIVREDKKPFISASYAGALASPEPITMRVDEPRLVDAFKLQVFPSKVETEGYPYNFFAGTDYSTAARIAMFYVDSVGGKRVGFAYCNGSAFCKEPIKAVHTHARALGLELGRDLMLEMANVKEADYQRLVLEYFRQELAQQQAVPGYKPVDWLWMGNTVKTTVWLAKALATVERELGLKVQIIVNAWGLDETVFATCGEDCVGRIHGVMPFAAWGDTRAPEMAKVMALHDKYRELDGDGKSYKNVRYVQGYASVLMLKTAIERVLAQGKPVNGKNVHAALESFRNVDLGGLCDKITFNAQDHRPQSNAFIYKITPAGALQAVPPDRKIAMERDWLGW